MIRPQPRIRVLVDENEAGLVPKLDPRIFDVKAVTDFVPQSTPDNVVAWVAHTDRRWLITSDRGITAHVRSQRYSPASLAVTRSEDAPAERLRKLHRYLPEHAPRAAPGTMIDLRRAGRPRVVRLVDPPKPSPGATPISKFSVPRPQPRLRRRRPGV